MKKIVLINILMCSCFLLNAQNSHISKIRSDYSEIQKSIQNQRTDIPKNDISIIQNQNVAGIGEQKIEYKFWFDIIYYDSDDMKHRLDFATRKYHIAASVYSYEEFMFDNAGNLSFYYIRLNSEYEKIDYEIRLYFNNKKLIKVIAKELQPNGNRRKSSDYKKTFESADKVPNYFSDNYKNLPTLAKDIKNLFYIVDETFNK